MITLRKINKLEIKHFFFFLVLYCWIFSYLIKTIIFANFYKIYYFKCNKMHLQMQALRNTKIGFLKNYKIHLLKKELVRLKKFFFRLFLNFRFYQKKTNKNITWISFKIHLPIKNYSFIRWKMKLKQCACTRLKKRR